MTTIVRPFSRKRGGKLIFRLGGGRRAEGGFYLRPKYEVCIYLYTTTRILQDQSFFLSPSFSVTPIHGAPTNLGNETSYRRSAAVKTTGYLRAFQISQKNIFWISRCLYFWISVFFWISGHISGIKELSEAFWCQNKQIF